MGIAYNPRTITDGLVLALDAANPKSYPGSGTTWTDLSGNGNNGTLLNGVGYSGDNLGSLVFDGINDHANLNVSPLTTAQREGSLTYGYWIKPTGTIRSNYTESNGGAQFYNPGSPTFQGLSGDNLYNYDYDSEIYAGFGFAFGTNGFVAGIHKNDYAPPILVDYKTYNGIFYLVVIKNLTNCSYYINGSLIKTSLNATNGVTIIGDSMIKITSAQDSFTRYYKGDIYSVQFYSRQLNLSEIQQNFNATRSRFGI